MYDRMGVSGRVSLSALLLSAMSAAPMACRSDASDASTPPEAATARIVCSFAPMYLFARNIIGDTPNVEVEMLLPAAQGCPHDYELSVRDARRLARADVLIVHGGIERFDEATVRRINPRIRWIEARTACDRLASGKGDLAQRAEDPAEHEHGPHEPEVNPHAWVSPRQAARQVRMIGDALAAYYPAHAGTVRANTQSYATRLEALAAEMSKAASRFRHHRVIASHDVFDYLARDLGLTVVATIARSAHEEPSAAHLAEVVRAARDQGVRAILCAIGDDRRLADRVAAEAGSRVIELDPVSTTSGRAATDDYERRMRRNLNVMLEALQ